MYTVFLGPLCSFLKKLPTIFDEEVVGYIIGNFYGNRTIASMIILAKNLSKRPMIEFWVDPKDTFMASKVAEKYVLELIGIFHTHPKSNCYPSNLDKKNMKLWPVVWVISSKNCISAFTLSNKGEILEHNLVC